ncbi:DUF6597 domain-containing transcriptional factor [Paenibacillus sp. GYB004]|uniref:DUF6597 domain-containing transcriptional factor n=1 Tax=Paenibacillus sp. GYB004 TaxID=2994393 RepID=UPI002F9651E3
MQTNVDHSGKGILNQEAGKHKFLITRHAPSPELAPFILRYWVARWDLRGEPPYRQVVLSHPNVNLVFEKENTRIYGIPLQTSSQLLYDEGMVLGVMFKPGGFYPFWQSPVSGLTGRSVRFEEAFGCDARPVEEHVLSAADDAGVVEAAERFFRERLPHADDSLDLACRIVETIERERAITKVDDVVSRFGYNKRTIQRLFDKYVGVTRNGSFSGIGCTRRRCRWRRG